MRPPTTILEKRLIDSRNASIWGGKDTIFGVLPRQVHLDEHPHRIGRPRVDLLGEPLRVDRMDEPRRLEHGADLAALEMADEVEDERVADDRALGLEVLEAVLADDGRPGLHEGGGIGGGHVLAGEDDLDLTRTPACARSARVDGVACLLEGETESAWVDHAASMAMTPPCRPVRAPSRRYE